MISKGILYQQELLRCNKSREYVTFNTKDYFKDGGTHPKCNFLVFGYSLGIQNQKTWIWQVPKNCIYSRAKKLTVELPFNCEDNT